MLSHLLVDLNHARIRCPVAQLDTDGLMELAEECYLAWRGHFETDVQVDRLIGIRAGTHDSWREGRGRFSCAPTRAGVRPVAGPGKRTYLSTTFNVSGCTHSSNNF